MYSVGDKVVIIDSMDSSWIGKEATITRSFKYPNEPRYYELNLGGGHWTGSMLKKI